MRQRLFVRRFAADLPLFFVLAAGFDEVVDVFDAVDVTDFGAVAVDFVVR